MKRDDGGVKMKKQCPKENQLVDEKHRNFDAIKILLDEMLLLYKRKHKTTERIESLRKTINELR